MYNLKNLYITHQDAYINKLYQFVNSSRYEVYQEFYDPFIGVMDGYDKVLETLNSNAFAFKDNVFNFKYNDYCHGNAHVAEVYMYMKRILYTYGKKITNRTKNIFLMTALLHDEALAFGGVKKSHHLDAMHHITGESPFTSYEVDVVVDGLLLPSREATGKNAMNVRRLGEQLFTGLIHTHRMSPQKAIDELSNLECVKELKIPELLLGSLSFCDKMGLINPLNVRNRTFSDNYDINVHMTKIANRFLNKESKDVNKEFFRKLFNVDGDSLFDYYTTACSDKFSEQHNEFIEYYEYVCNVEESGYIRLYMV